MAAFFTKWMRDVRPIKNRSVLRVSYENEVLETVNSLKCMG